MDLATSLRWAADRAPHRTAVSGLGRRLTYREWDERTERLARALGELGVRRGDRVALVMHGGEQLASLHLAAQKLGAVSVPRARPATPPSVHSAAPDTGSANADDAEPRAEVRNLGDEEHGVPHISR